MRFLALLCFSLFAFGTHAKSGNDVAISSSNLFEAGSNAAWPAVLTSTTTSDALNAEAQTLTTNVTLTVTVCGGTDGVVRMTGPWWGWDPNGGPIADANGDGTFSVVLPDVSESFEYLWVVNSGTENIIGQGCAPITDGVNYANRQWNVGDANPSDIYNYCDGCPSVLEGCTDEAANNYNADAEVDNGGCSYDVTEIGKED